MIYLPPGFQNTLLACRWNDTRHKWLSNGDPQASTPMKITLFPWTLGLPFDQKNIDWSCKNSFSPSEHNEVTNNIFYVESLYAVLIFHPTQLNASLCMTEDAHIHHFFPSVSYSSRYHGEERVPMGLICPLFSTKLNQDMIYRYWTAKKLLNLQGISLETHSKLWAIAFSIHVFCMASHVHM